MQQEWQRATEAWAIYSQELAQLGQRIDAQTWQKLLTLLAECQGKIVVTGVGTSGIAARKIAHAGLRGTTGHLSQSHRRGTRRSGFSTQ